MDSMEASAASASTIVHQSSEFVLPFVACGVAIAVAIGTAGALFSAKAKVKARIAWFAPVASLPGETGLAPAGARAHIPRGLPEATTMILVRARIRFAYFTGHRLQLGDLIACAPKALVRPRPKGPSAQSLSRGAFAPVLTVDTTGLTVRNARTPIVIHPPIALRCDISRNITKCFDPAQVDAPLKPEETIVAPASSPTVH